MSPANQKSVGISRPIFCYRGSTNLPVINMHMLPIRQTVIISITASKNLCCGVRPKNFPDGLRFLGAGRGVEAGGVSSGKKPTGSLKSDDFDSSLRSPSNMGVFYHSAGRK